jgi:glycosyltransferase involved in cell wall biosynthesis
MTIPGKVQSYLRAGIPLIGMLDGEGAAVIREANAGLTCAAGDGRALAESVLTMAAMSAEKRDQLGQNGKNYAEREFDRSTLIDRLESLLQEAITSAGGNK